MREMGFSNERTKAFEANRPVLDQLVIISHLTRTTRRLLDNEIAELKKACAAFGDASRASRPERQVCTIKGHLIEVHVTEQAEKLGYVGRLGEDGMEAIHPMDTRCRMFTRNIKNPAMRLEAQQMHLTACQMVASIDRPKRQRRDNGQTAAASDPRTPAAALAPATITPASS